ncbi:MAG: divalent metal cation transporter, partial [Phycisphaeraceae bacterium]
SLMWVQPLAMIMGIIMLSAIGYVVLSTGQRPFDAINEHVNPVLGWAWLLATMAANMVWCMPQFALADGALKQNLLPAMGIADSGDTVSYVITGVLAAIALIVVWFYNSGGKGIKIFEIIVKLMVALIVVSFVGAVGYATMQGEVDWAAVFAGFIPNANFLTEPAPALKETIEQTGAASDFWTEHVVSGQRNRMIAVAATAVGINMTFLLPYSMLARGWDKDFRGMAIFDLATGLFIPFILVTSCVVIAAGLQMYNQPAPGLYGAQTHPETGEAIEPDPAVLANYESLIDSRILWELRQDDPALYANLSAEQESNANRLASLTVALDAGQLETAVANDPTLKEKPLEAAVAARVDDVSDADRKVASRVVNRDLVHLAAAVAPLTGENLAHIVFGIGVVGVALSTIVILMLINGFVFTEALNLPGNPVLHRIGASLAMLVGAIGAHTLWVGEAKAYMAVPTSVFGMMLAPIAYLTFFCLMNNRKVLGDAMPTGFRRIWWNLIMFVATAFAFTAAGWAVWNESANFPGTSIERRWVVVGAVVFFFLVGLLIHFRRKHAAALDAPVGAAAASPGGGSMAATATDLDSYFEQADDDVVDNRPTGFDVDDDDDSHKRPHF